MITTIIIPGLQPPPNCLPEFGKSVSKVGKGLLNIKNREKKLLTQQRIGVNAWNNIQRDNDTLKLNKQEMFDFSYKPYVIAALAWDYADSIAKLSANMKFEKEAKRLSREINLLRDAYNRYRSDMIDAEGRDSEIKNMYIFEDGTEEITSKLILNIRCRLNGFDEVSTLYLTAVWQCEILLGALFRYCRTIADKLSAKFNREIGDVLPPQVKKLLSVVTACSMLVSESPNVEDLKQQYVEVYATQIALIQLEELQ